MQKKVITEERGFFLGDIMKRHLSLVSLFVLSMLVPAAAFAQSGAEGSDLGLVPLGVAFTMGIAALGGTFGQAKAISAALEAIGRNPSAAGQVQTPMLIGLAFVESLVVLAFAIAFLLLP